MCVRVCMRTYVYMYKLPTPKPMQAKCSLPFPPPGSPHAYSSPETAQTFPICTQMSSLPASNQPASVLT